MVWLTPPSHPLLALQLTGRRRRDEDDEDEEEEEEEEEEYEDDDEEEGVEVTIEDLLASEGLDLDDEDEEDYEDDEEGYEDGDDDALGDDEDMIDGDLPGDRRPRAPPAASLVPHRRVSLPADGVTGGGGGVDDNAGMGSFWSSSPAGKLDPKYRAMPDYTLVRPQVPCPALVSYFVHRLITASPVAISLPHLSSTARSQTCRISPPTPS